MNSESSWSQRINKVRHYLNSGDLSGLMAEIRQFWDWKLGWKHGPKISRSQPGAEALPTDKGLNTGERGDLGASQDRPRTEAAFWDHFDADLGRKVSWGSASGGILGRWAFQKMCDGQYPDIVDLISDVLKAPRSQPLRGLVLGCGDMVGEHAMFVHPSLPFAEVDAYDVSPKSIEQARQLTDGKGLKVNYHVVDVNELELAPGRYALIVIFHAFHHFERVDHVARQINRALLPGGVFYTSDYVGACKLQFTDCQLFYAQMMLRLLPVRCRRELNGEVREHIRRVSPDTLSPDEAICSDQILPAMARHLDVVWQYNWGGLLYPLLEGIAFNFTTDSEDLSFLKFLFNLDYALCQAGEVEPAFTVTVASKRQTGTADSA